MTTSRRKGKIGHNRIVLHKDTTGLLAMNIGIEAERAGKAGTTESTGSTGTLEIRGTTGTTETGIMEGTRKGENTAITVTTAGSHATTLANKGTTLVSSLQGTPTGAMLPNTVSPNLHRQRLHVPLPAGELHSPTLTAGRN